MDYILQQIKHLPTQRKRIMVLKYLHNKKESEIAALMGLTVKTVYNQIGKACKAIKINALRSCK